VCRSRVQSRLTPRQQAFCSIERTPGEYTRIGDQRVVGEARQAPLGRPDRSCRFPCASQGLQASSVRPWLESWLPILAQGVY
jgi:hypothetical protein